MMDIAGQLKIIAARFALNCTCFSVQESKKHQLECKTRYGGAGEVMGQLVFVVAVFIAAGAIAFFEMHRTPAGVVRESCIEQRRIFSRTRTVIDAEPDEVIHLLQSDWSWWKKARAEKMKDLGNGRKEFLFHPVRYFNFIEVPPVFLIRLDGMESMAGGGKRIPATIVGDFEGRAEYTVCPAPGGTTVELAWCGVEPRSMLRHVPIALVAAIHCWRERIGIEGLRDRFKAKSRGA